MNMLAYYAYHNANPILLIILVLVVVACIPSWGYNREWGPAPLGLIILLVVLFFLFGCAPTTTTHVDNAATRTGQNLVGALSTVMQDYADVKKDGVASLWSISKGVNAYSTVVKSTADVKQLIADWKSTKGDGSFLTRITEVLNNADVTPQTKALATAKAAELVASNKSP